MYDKNHNYQLDNSGNPITEDEYNVECGAIAQQIKTIPELSFCVNGKEEMEETVIHYKIDTSENNILDLSGNKIVDKEEKVIKQTPLGLNYQNLFCYNIKAVQELYKKVIELEAIINKQQKEITKLKLRK